MLSRFIYKKHTHIYISSPPLLDVMIVGAFLQSPGLPLLWRRVIAVVVQQEGPHLATDGWVDTTEEDGLAERVEGEQKGQTGGTQWGITSNVRTYQTVCKHDVQTAVLITQPTADVLQDAAKLKPKTEKTNTVWSACPVKNSALLFLYECVYRGNVLGHSLTATESFQ